MKAKKTIGKTKKNLKSNAECYRESFKSGDFSASDSSSSLDSDSNSDLKNMEVKLIRTRGQPRGFKNIGLLNYVC